jgi:conjugal transfer pilus assembly protein TraV
MKRAAMTRTAIVALCIAGALTGCASTLSGLGGAQGYACKAPDGAMCTSISGVYANTAQPAKPPAKTSRSPAPALSGASAAAPAASAGSSSSPLRSPSRVLRLWIAPWEDADGDLHEESLVHVVVDTGRWLIEHARPARRARLEGVAPPLAPAPAPSSAKVPDDAPPAAARLPTPPAGLSPGAEPAATAP